MIWPIFFDTQPRSSAPPMRPAPISRMGALAMTHRAKATRAAIAELMRGGYRGCGFERAPGEEAQGARGEPQTAADRFGDPLIRRVVGDERHAGHGGTEAKAHPHQCGDLLDPGGAVFRRRALELRGNRA